MGQRKRRYVGRAIAAAGWRIWDNKLQRFWGEVYDPFPQALLDEREKTAVAFSPREEVAAAKTARQVARYSIRAAGCYRMNVRRSAARNMTVPTGNETWVIEMGGTVICKIASRGIECLSPWEMLVYCLWVADYGMRNAGDLDTAADVYPDFHLHARRIAESLSLRLTHEAFSLPQRDFEREYFDRFESICNEIRDGELRASSSG